MRSAVLVLLALAPLAVRAAEPAPTSPSVAPPDGWVDLATLPGVRLDVRYATSENFTGAPLDGYGAGRAWLRAEPAAALGRVAVRLQEDGWDLVVYDAYRPERASRAMVGWAERTGQTHLLRDGWIAARSGHNRGHVVDVSVVDRATGSPVDMGSPWDHFGEASITANATGEVAARRARLLEAMAAEGFTNYRKEWWHYAHGSGPWASADHPYPPEPVRPAP